MALRYLITGHTGFKGSWLSLLLASRGHEVAGIALDPPAGGMFERAGVRDVLSVDERIDIRDADAVSAAVDRIAPDVILHLAAQALVRRSYREPRLTYETNVVGTLNVLEAASRADSVRASVIVTTDKVYRNVGQTHGYVEGDALGGDDPYSGSKAAADLLAQSWVASVPGPPTAVARAGNVIGGGDVSEDRLLVDLVDGFSSGDPVHIRYPDAVRPWQHVLDCVNGYTALADALLSGTGAGEWNFGPDPESFQTVRQVADLAAARWGGDARWVDDSGDHPHEAAFLTLDSSRTQRDLDWRNAILYPDSLEWTIDWYRAVADGADPLEVSRTQLQDFESMLRSVPASEG